jgi:hypothetical protein
MYNPGQLCWIDGLVDLMDWWIGELMDCDRQWRSM